jgi:serine/threonine-protein kinase HipA
MSDVDVYLGDSLTGRLTRSQQKHVFGYQLNATTALSLTMPLRTESYNYDGLHPVFQMNLPEGYLRQAIERATAKLYGSDDLTLLTLLGHHQVGKLRYSLADTPLAKNDVEIPKLPQLLGSENATLFDQLLQRYALSSGISGVQPKVLLETQGYAPDTQVTDKATLPLKKWIVKAWGQEFPELARNEFICLTLARHAGLVVPDFFVSDNGKLLITERFDVDENGEAIGFEDFCVLQGKGTAEKYDGSLESCTNTIRHFVSPESLTQALYDFFKLTLINVRIKNGDAHLKNIGVIYPDLRGYHEGEIPDCRRTLAPIFDIVSTTPYLPNDLMALSLTGSKRWPKWKVLEKFGRQHCGLTSEKIEKIVGEVEHACTMTLPILKQIAHTSTEFKPIAERLGEFLERNHDTHAH